MVSINKWILVPLLGFIYSTLSFSENPSMDQFLEALRDDIAQHRFDADDDGKIPLSEFFGKHKNLLKVLSCTTNATKDEEHDGHSALTFGSKEDRKQLEAYIKEQMRKNPDAKSLPVLYDLRERLFISVAEPIPSKVNQLIRYADLGISKNYLEKKAGIFADKDKLEDSVEPVLKDLLSGVKGPGILIAESELKIKLETGHHRLMVWLGVGDLPTTEVVAYTVPRITSGTVNLKYADFRSYEQKMQDLRLSGTGNPVQTPERNYNYPRHQNYYYLPPGYFIIRQ